MGKRRKPQKVVQTLSDYVLDENGPLPGGPPKGDDGNSDLNDSEYKDMFAEGLISLEEVDEEESARILAGYKPTLPEKEKKSKKDDGLISKIETKKKKKTGKATPPPPVVKVSKGDSNLPLWNDALDPLLKIALNDLEFTKPTEIQKEILSSALSDDKKDIFGCAPTGSGKTLAFLLPILQYCIKNTDTSISFSTALIVVPTRELAIQINNTLRSLLLNIPKIHSVTLVGGLSDIKQKRVLAKSPQIIVGTPGRVAELLCKAEDGSGNSNYLKRLKFLVLDEADRLVEKGHFKDLDTILTTIQKNHWAERSTMLFSATLRLDDLSSIRKKIQFTNPFIVDLKKANPVLLKQSSIYSLPEDRNGTLLTLLLEILQKDVKVLIFVNAIETVREISTFLSPFTLLPAAQTLHAHMQQKQRMKHLERFTSNTKAIMVTSDVAARGIDIPQVDYVIHYHVPRRRDTFLHRSGRTARAERGGSSILLVTPADVPLLDGLGSGENDVVGEIKYSFSPKYNTFLYGSQEMAKKASVISEELAKFLLKDNKAKRDFSWQEKASEVLGIDLDHSRGGNKRSLLDDADSDLEDNQSNSKNSISEKDRIRMLAEIAEIIKKIN